MADDVQTRTARIVRVVPTTDRHDRLRYGITYRQGTAAMASCWTYNDLLASSCERAKQLDRPIQLIMSFGTFNPELIGADLNVPSEVA